MSRFRASRQRLAVCWVVALLALLLAGAGRVVAAGDPGIPRLALRASDRTAAARAVLRLSDLPSGWKRIASWPVDRTVVGAGCGQFNPDLSRLVVTGLSGRTFLGPDRTQQASSLVVVLRSREEAAWVFSIDYGRYYAECVRSNLGQIVNGLRIIGARRLQLPAPAGARVIAMRGVVDFGQAQGVIDQVFALRGRAVVKMIFQSGIDEPFSVVFEAELTKRIAGRLRVP